jgi:hypothetical protein
MTLETGLSIAMLGVFIWVLRFLLPKALKEHDSFGVGCALLAALLALGMWLLTGVSMRSASF